MDEFAGFPGHTGSVVVIGTWNKLLPTKATFLTVGICCKSALNGVIIFA